MRWSPHRLGELFGDEPVQLRLSEIPDLSMSVFARHCIDISVAELVGETAAVKELGFVF